MASISPTLGTIRSAKINNTMMVILILIEVTAAAVARAMKVIIVTEAVITQIHQMNILIKIKTITSSPLLSILDMAAHLKHQGLIILAQGLSSGGLKPQ